jgi:7,8-dihydro-6-hydroxymethylpterin dimethyltransferase
MKSVKTESLCPVCLEIIPAVRTVREGKIYLFKKCPEHGEFQALLWRDADLYEQWSQGCEHAAPVKAPEEKLPVCPYDCGLCSAHEGGTCTAIFHLTDACNMSCPVCFASGGQESHDHGPTLEAIRRMYALYIDQGQSPSIQLSGGEATLRDDLPDIIRMGKDMGTAHIQVNTNGLRLAKEKDYAIRLKDAGADLIYLQFDGVSDEVYRTLRGRNMRQIKLTALDHCRKAGIGVLLVPTVYPDVNDHQLGDIVKVAKEWMPVVKGIHFQPVSFFGRFPGRSPRDQDRITIPDVLKALEQQTGGEIPMEAVVPRRRFDSHCAFSSVFLLGKDQRLHPITEGESPPAVKTKIKDPDHFPIKANAYTNKFWRMGDEGSDKQKKTPAAEVAQRLRNYTLSITGMHFQDVWTIDLQRLKGCCVHVTTPDQLRIPLCAYYLTGVDGRRLYGTTQEAHP